MGNTETCPIFCQILPSSGQISERITGKQCRRNGSDAKSKGDLRQISVFYFFEEQSKASLFVFVVIV